jgi:hypothetical protein
VRDKSVGLAVIVHLANKSISCAGISFLSISESAFFQVPTFSCTRLLIASCVARRLQLPIDGFPREVMQLPTRHGGLGFCPSAETAPHAFAAGMAAALAALGKTTDCRLRMTFAQLTQLPYFQKLARVLHEEYAVSALKFQDKRELTNVHDFLAHFGPKNVVGLQSRLMQTVRANRAAEVRARGTDTQKARLDCRSNKSSASIWQAYPLTQAFMLSDREMRFLVAYSTGALPQETPQYCSCRMRLTLEHMVTCGPAKLTRHNMLQARFVAFSREHGVATKQNPRMTLEDAKENQEPDIIFFSGAAAAQETDITVVNPCSHSYICNTLKNVRSATHRAHGLKTRKYLEGAKQRGHSFTPLVFETHGHVHADVLTLLATFAANIAGRQGFAVRNMALELQLTLVRGNATCARLAVARAQRHQDFLRGLQQR